MQYWLMKSEPDVFSLDDLIKKPKKIEGWDGVRNYQARNYIKSMQIGDLAFFYHSNAKPSGIVGIIEIAGEAYPDISACDPLSKYYDPKSQASSPRWFMVDVKFKEKFDRMITLEELKKLPELSEWELVKRGNRLSIMRVSSSIWQRILTLV